MKSPFPLFFPLLQKKRDCSKQAQCSKRRLIMALLAVSALAPANLYAASKAKRQPPLVAHVYPDTLALPYNRYALKPFMRPARKSVAVALSGGGANALAQIGVLKAFEEAHIPVDAIAGTSMGAIIGGLYSCGYSAAELEQLALTMPWSSILALQEDYSRSSLFVEQQRIRDRATIALRFDGLKLLLPQSLNSAQAFTRTMDMLVLHALYHPHSNFSSLPIAFRAVTTDLVSGERVTLESGSLSEAMRASSTVPILFEPIHRAEQQLVDGGLVANLPVDELAHFGADCKIAIDTHGSMYATGKELDLPWKAADQAMTILITLQYPAQRAQASLVIEPETGKHKATDFKNIPQLIAAGYVAGKQQVPTLQRLLAITSPSNSSAPQTSSVPPSSIVPSVATPPPISPILTANKKEMRNFSLATYTKRWSISPTSTELERLVGEKVASALELHALLRDLLATDYFARVSAEVHQEDRTVTVKLEALPSVTVVTVQGELADELSSAELNECFAPLMGRLYTNHQATAALEALVRRLRAKGYSLAAIEQVHVENERLTITFSSGKAAMLTISLNKGRTLLTPIQRELKLDATKPLRLRAAEESVKNLYETGVFNRVSLFAEPITQTEAIAPISSTTPNQTIHLSLEEKPASVLRLGLRYDETNNAQLLLDVRNENVGGTTNTMGGWVKAGRKGYLANMELNMPRIGATHLIFATRLFFDSYLFDYTNSDGSLAPYNIQKYGITSSFGTRLRKNGHFLTDVSYYNSQAFTDEAHRPLFSTTNNNVLTIGTHLTIDSRNNALMPTRGSYSYLTYAFTPLSLDDGLRYWQFSGTHQVNLPLGRETTLQLSAMTGVSSKALPLSEQYFLGGIGNSYSARFIGLQPHALATNNVATAGVQLSYEPSFPILFPTTLQLHYNAGRGWNAMENVRLDGALQGALQAVGASMVWKTPLGPTRFTLAKVLVNNDDNSLMLPHRDDDPVFYFSIGHDF
uniref:PNPLA domain-containing protein n=1 Tax=Chlorobium chlorochromatii (strain CaD3) TaxID=340177 RepID=Q3ATV9_CHLCH